MNANVRDDLLCKLIVLSFHYPTLRFGQLLAFACSVADDQAPGTVDNTTDEAASDGIQTHLHQRFGTRGSEIENGFSALTETRGQLVNALKELGQGFPHASTGQLVARLAALAHVNVYDIEDEQLLKAARSREPGLQWFEWYTERLANKSVLRERKDQWSYRCPCCSCRTLYERGGFEICPVCNWEDDGQDDEDADSVRGGPNGALSLTEARFNYAKEGVCDSQYREHVRPPRPDEL